MPYSILPKQAMYIAQTFYYPLVAVWDLAVQTLSLQPGSFSRLIPRENLKAL